MDGCVRSGMPGWMTLSENIVVAFWPRGSAVDQRYGIGSVGSGGGAGNGTEEGGSSGWIVD